MKNWYTYKTIKTFAISFAGNRVSNDCGSISVGRI